MEVILILLDLKHARRYIKKISLKILLKTVQIPTTFILIVLMIFPQLCVAKKFEVVVGLVKQPYVMGNNISGFEIELVRNILKLMGKSVEFVFIPYGHSSKLLAIKNIDAMMSVSDKSFKDNARLSKAYINYLDVAISLKSSNLTIDKISDLSKYSVASFQQAENVLGTEFSEAITKSPMFIETTEQNRQLTLLISGKVEVLVMDKNIFRYHAIKQKLTQLNNEVVFHKIFPKSPLKMAFKDKKHIVEFNNTFDEYSQSEDYKRLIKKYDMLVE